MPLPPDWRRRPLQEGGVWTSFGNDKTGLIVKDGFDPRKKYEAMAARGVEFRRFDLV
jgi:hypothetical protein